jgi:hypothetical protein
MRQDDMPDNRLTAEVCKLTLVSELLFHIARDSLDLSSAALMGMIGIVDEVVETLNPKQKGHNE